MSQLIASFLIGVLAAQSTPVPAGTHVKARLESAVRTETSKAGDPVVAILTDPIRIGNRIIVPEGSRLNGRVETIEAASRSNEGRVRLVFREVQLPDGRRNSIWITESFTAKPRKQGLRYVLLMGGGSAAGAFIGGTAARVAGILGGLIAGFVIAENSGQGNRSDLTLNAGQIVVLQLGEDFSF